MIQDIGSFLFPSDFHFEIDHLQKKLNYGRGVGHLQKYWNTLHGNVRKCYEIFVNVRKYLEMFGDVSKCLKKLRNVWKCFAGMSMEMLRHVRNCF